VRLITYAQGPGTLPRLAVRVGHRVLDIESGSRVDGEGRGAISRVQALAKAAQTTAGRFSGAMLEEKAIRFLPPIPDGAKLRSAGVNHRARFEELKGNGLMDEMPAELSGFEKAGLLPARAARAARWIPQPVVRPPVLCAGCPHTSMFMAVRASQATAAG
jgi:hypothetical protein